MINALSVTNQPRKDGNGVIIKINTGIDTGVSTDNYRHVVAHNLGRFPVGAQIVWQDNYCEMYVISQDKNNITLKFDTAQVTVHVRIF